MTEYIESLGYLVIANCRDRLQGRLELDAFIPSEMKAFEFQGEYWHGPTFVNTAGESASERAIRKHKIAAERNIEVFYVWERDWLTKTDEVKRAICNALRKSQRPEILLAPARS